MGFRHGDPEAIRMFAQQLREFCEDAKGGMGRLRAQLDEIGRSHWTDDNHRIYQDDFSHVVAELHKTLQSFEEDQSHRLERLAQQYDDVHY